MRIKLKDIAEELRISPATVSLAVNDRPGISEKTKEKILAYIRSKEEKDREREWNPAGSGSSVAMINYLKNGIILNRSGKNHPVLEQIKKEVRAGGYDFVYLTFNEMINRIQDLIRECRNRDVKGIYIMAAEMSKADIYPFLELKIPIVTGDNLFYEEGIDSFLIDNREGIRRGVDYLVD